ncbi:MAG: MqnA/MqnD/SBP family protein [Phycisphaerae bacterium]
MPEPLRIATVPYLNGRPLVYGLAEREDVVLAEAPPSALGGLLRRGEADAALLPSIEYFRLAAEGGERARGGSAAGVVALPVAAIGSRGAVGSVRLFGYAAPPRVRRVRLDAESRTSNVLARLVVSRAMNLAPHFAMPEEGGPGARPPDAEVMIGDRALAAAPEAAEWVMDLGEAWEHLVRLPFVYAFWTARTDADLARLVAVLTAARDAGLAARAAIADAAADDLGLSAETLRTYLSEMVRYAFGRREQKGLVAFYRMAVAEGLAPAGSRLRVVEGGSRRE